MQTIVSTCIYRKKKDLRYVQIPSKITLLEKNCNLIRPKPKPYIDFRVNTQILTFLSTMFTFHE